MQLQMLTVPQLYRYRGIYIVHLKQTEDHTQAIENKLEAEEPQAKGNGDIHVHSDS